MIYLTNGNTPLNAAYADKISQEANSTYQLTFRFPTSDALWEKLKEEAFLKADDLHGEQDFVIFEVQKKHGYIQVYANQSFTLLNNYVINPISLDRATGSTALSRFAGSITRENPFSFFSDIDERHTFNTDSVNAMVAFTKDKHSILGQWGGDLVRHGYQVQLLKNGGSENESLFMYKKNLSSYQQKTSTKSLKTRITFKTTVKGEGEKAPDRKFSVVVDSPLINKYSQIYEDVIEVNDQDVKDEAGLRKYGEQYFRTTLCDMLEDSLEIQVEGKSDVPVQIFDVVSLFHDRFKMDVRKKITKYTYSPMAKKLLSIGFGKFKSGLSNMLSNAVNDAVKNETQHLQGQFATQLAKEIKNADLAFENQKEELVNQFTDEVNAIKAKAEENKRALSDEINRRFHDFSPAGFEEAKTKAEEALKKAGTSEDLAKEAKIIANNSLNKLNDNAEQFAEYKQSVSERIGNLVNRMTGKVDQVDFQSVKETAQLYERILGNTDNGIANNVARMALTNQLFQVEVSKYSTQGGPNMLRNSRADDGLKYWTEANGRLGFTAHKFYFNGQKRMFELRPGAVVKSPRFIVKRGADYTLNILGFDNNSKYFRVYFCKRKKGSNADFEEKQLVFDGSPQWTDGPVFNNSKAVKKSFHFNVGDFDDGYLQFEYDRNNPNKWGGLFMTELDFYEGSNDRKWQPAPEDSAEPIEAVRTQMTLLQGSWAVQNLTNAGSIVSQINATNNQILIEAEKIRLKGKTLLDELTAIDGYFKRLFVGDARIGTLNTDIIRSNSIAAEKLIFDTALAKKLVSSDVFTDQLAAKEAFINKLRSVVVSATLLEGYKGRIGGFQIGTHDKDPNSYWLTGQNQFKVGMGSGSGHWAQTALWVNWGNNWGKAGDSAWYVRNDGKMFCYNQAEFWNTPIIHGNLKVSGNIYYITDDNTKEGGYWIYSPSFRKIEERSGYAYLYRFDKSYSWFALNKDVSDRRYKHNIEDSKVSALEVIDRLKTYSYRKEYDGKVEDISCGIMAQDVQQVAPEAFLENPDGAYSYNTFVLLPYLIKAIQELNQKVERLETTT